MFCCGSMENHMRPIFYVLTVFALLSSIDLITPTGGEVIGVNYGMKGGNLPSPDQVVSLYRARGIHKLRLFHPDASALTALRDSGIDVVLGTLNEDLARLASDTSFATSWVATNVVPHHPAVKFRYITAGNEVVPGDLAGHVLPAMQNLEAALKDAGVDEVPVTTAVASNVLGTSYPPSQGAFSEAAAAVMVPIVKYLQGVNAPLLVNVYPYFAYADNPQQVHLDYALISANSVVVQDGSVGYTSLFDAMLDAVYAALDKAGAGGVDVVVAETGWPSGGGGVGATLDNARIYNNNLIAHVRSGNGTPRRPGKAIETYLFAMFNEDQKTPGTEQHFGLYQPDMTEVYHINLET